MPPRRLLHVVGVNTTEQPALLLAAVQEATASVGPALCAPTFMW